MSSSEDVPLAEVADQLRRVLAALDDPEDELTASAATRRRLQGAVLALDTLVADQG